jgi:hypothetical protein
MSELRVSINDAPRVLEEPREVARAESTKPFRNAPRRAARRVADLIGGT